MSFKRSVAASLLVGLAAATLDKPAISPDLNYLNGPMLRSLNSTASNVTQWAPGFIPSDCDIMARSAGYSSSDIQVFSVQYADCGDPWIMCRHTGVPDPFANMVDLFGRLPVSVRQWVRHIINLPNPSGGFAYNWNGNIAMFNRVNGDINVWVHEAAHSLDLLGAFSPDKPLSNSTNWANYYNADSGVPDNYARSNQVENVAQCTVVSMFDRNVPGGYRGVEPNWLNDVNQINLLEFEADRGGNLLTPGGTCTKRLTNSNPVAVAPKRRTRARDLSVLPIPNVSLSPRVAVIPPKLFDTRDTGCPYATPH